MIKQSNIYSVVGINKNYIFYIFHNFKFHVCLRSSGEYAYYILYYIYYRYIKYIFYIHIKYYIYIYISNPCTMYMYTYIYCFGVENLLYKISKLISRFTHKEKGLPMNEKHILYLNCNI